MRKARLSPEAEAELYEAAAWYKQRRPEIARRFLHEVRVLTKVVGRTPQRFPALLEPELEWPVQRALVPGFPYALVFVVADDAVHVLAVAHQHRLPGYWLDRIRRK